MKKLYTFLAAAFLAVTASAQDVDLYLVGAFNNWNNGDPTYMFTNKGEGVYEITVDDLLSQFKVTDGDWVAPYNLGGDGSGVVLGTPAQLVEDSNSNLFFADYDGVLNAFVTVNLNDNTITVSGEGYTAEKVWYIQGVNGDWATWSTDNQFTKNSDNGCYEISEFLFSAAGEFKLATESWVNEYGSGAETSAIAFGNFSTQLYVSGGNVEYSILGTFGIRFNPETEVIEFVQGGLGGVNEITVDLNNAADAIYYNLQGVRVDNPTNGVYIRQQNGSAVKVLVK